jgi:hypothetical protein
MKETFFALWEAMGTLSLIEALPPSQRTSVAELLNSRRAPQSLQAPQLVAP